MPRAKKTYVVCLDNEGYEGALERNKIYVVLSTEGPGFLRVIDDSGEDYLYGAERFVEIEVPKAVARSLSASP